MILKDSFSWTLNSRRSRRRPDFMVVYSTSYDLNKVQLDATSLFS